MDITVKNFFKSKTSEEYTRCFDRMNMYFKLTEYANEDRFPLDGKLLLNAYYAFSGLKSIFETGFKRHSEPRLPSTAQINH